MIIPLLAHPTLVQAPKSATPHRPISRGSSHNKHQPPQSPLTMQSGISASAELHAAFQTLLTTPSQRGLLITITSETLVPISSLPSTTSSFHTDLSSLTPHLTPTAALYILLRRPDTLTTSTPAGSLIAVTYIPDAAPVRQKTLFASTRLTLVRELGSEHFGGSIFATEKDELSPQGWERYEAHEGGEAPLTQEERDLVGIKEAEAGESGGTGGRKGHTGGGLEVRVGEGVVEGLRGLGRQGDLVQLKFDIPTETIVLDSTTNTTPAGLAGAIEAAAPRYSFYRHTNDAVVFIYTCPTTSKIRERMIYASSKSSVLNMAASEAGVKVAKKLEASNPDEITEQTIEEEFKDTIVETKAAFSKPKRPGRR